jgi:hypothetical protein
MKAEINNENKAKFFALYWGQKVIELEGYEELVNPYVAHLNNDGRRTRLNAQILLKPLSSISDEDKKIVTKYHNTNLVKINDSGGFEPWDDGDFILWNVDQIDYLRSKGYALPWMGLSVNVIVKAVWIKLIEA